MISELHQHMVIELQQSSKTDTVFVISAVFFNLIVLGINWGVANAAQEGTGGNDLIFAVLVIATILINLFCIRALLAGRQTRTRLISGLIEMYKDNGIEKYYDPMLLDTYSTRYRLFVSVLYILGGIAIIVPLLERILS